MPFTWMESVPTTSDKALKKIMEFKEAFEVNRRHMHRNFWPSSRLWMAKLESAFTQGISVLAQLLRASGWVLKAGC